MSVLRSQHGSGLVPVRDAELIAAVGDRLSSLANGQGDLFMTPEEGDEEFCRIFAERAECFPRAGAVVAKGATWKECHTISAEIVDRDPERYALIFGYALDIETGGDMWRTHSFVWDRKQKRVVEPTPGIRDAYAGAILSRDETERFIVHVGL